MGDLPEHAGPDVGADGGGSRRSLQSLRGLWQRLRPPVWTALALFLLFNIFRAVLLIICATMVRGVGPMTVARSFWIGLRYDAIPVGYILLPMVAASMFAPERLLNARWMRRVMAAYASSAITLVLVVEMIGAGFFLRFGARMNWIALGYLGGEVARHILYTYPSIIALGLAIPLMIWIFYRLFSRAFRRSPIHPVGAPVRIAVGVVLLVVCVIACRGSASRRPLRLGKAYQSTNLIVAQLALNNFVTVGRAAINDITDGRGERGMYPFPTFEAAARLVPEMLRQQQDVFLGDPSNPLCRRTITGRERTDYNVVVIMMESMAGKPVGALGHSPSQTPNLDKICREGLFFERMYAVGARTSRGLTGVLCGHPDLGGESVFNRPKALGRFLTLPAILRSRGYGTMFFCGGNPDFDNMRKFLTAGGVEEVFGGDDLAGLGPKFIWGYSDEAIFRKAHERFELMGDKPFFAAIMTASNHEPYQVPQGRSELLSGDSEQERFINAFRYADWALGEFFRMARGSSYFDRTIFVLVADHGQNLDKRRIIDVPGYRLPCVIYAPALADVVPVGSIEAVTSQTDIAPTVLSMLGGEFEHCFMGRNALEIKPSEGFALLHEDDRLGFVTRDTTLILPPNRKPILFRTDALSMRIADRDEIDPRRIAQLQERMLSYYFMAKTLYDTGRYNCPPNPDP